MSLDLFISRTLIAGKLWYFWSSKELPTLGPLSWRDFWDALRRTVPWWDRPRGRRQRVLGGRWFKVSYFEWSKVLILHKNRMKNCLLPVGHLSVSFVFVYICLYIHLQFLPKWPDLLKYALPDSFLYVHIQTWVSITQFLGIEHVLLNSKWSLKDIPIWVS